MIRRLEEISVVIGGRNRLPSAVIGGATRLDQRAL